MTEPESEGGERFTTHVAWRRETPDFTAAGFGRTHRWRFGGGMTLPASAAAAYQGEDALPNPEEALLAALASCHMLAFLTIAARKRFTVNAYEATAEGVLEADEAGRTAMTRAVLRPRVDFGGGRQPDGETLRHMHALAHKHCFIANSLRTDVRIETPEDAAGDPA